MVVAVLGFYVPPTAKVIRRRDLGLKSHPKDWRSPGSNFVMVNCTLFIFKFFHMVTRGEDCNESAHRAVACTLTGYDASQDYAIYTLHCVYVCRNKRKAKSSEL